jgi:hypothetical protein
MLPLLFVLAVEPIQCRVDPISAMTTFEQEYRKGVSEEQADIRFVPGGSQRAMTYVDQRSHRLTTMVNVSSMSTDCPDTIRLMARHEACHVVHDGKRLADDTPLTPMERMHMEMQAGACALEIEGDK